MKKPVTIFFLLLSAVLIFGVLQALPPSSVSSEPADWLVFMRQAGAIDSDAYAVVPQNGELPLKFEGDTIRITKRDFDRVAAKKALYGDKNAAAHTREELLQREALYQMAVKAGYTVSDEELSAYMEQFKEDMRTATNADEFAAYLEGAGLTMDEYCQLFGWTYRQDMVLTAYFEPLRQEFLQKNNLSPGIEEANTRWSEEFTRMAEEYIAADNVVEYD